MTTPVLPRIRDYIHTNPNLVNDANGYVWVKHRDPKINRCDEIEGLQEISDKETCLTVATGFLSNEFQSLGFGPGVVGTPFLWAGGDTNVAHLPVGCSVPTDGAGRLNTRDIHYQTSTGDSGTTYSNGGRFDLKFCGTSSHNSTTRGSNCYNSSTSGHNSSTCGIRRRRR